MYLSRIVIYALIMLTPALIIAQTNAPGSSSTILQGGDNISSAYPISFVPFWDNGTTTGYTDDYDGTCGNDYGAPDVVYSLTPGYDMTIMISLCQSSTFDTRLYVFEDSPSNVIACNDDECSNQYSQYISQINCLNISPLHTYYIVIDGYGSASGDYSLDINLPVPAPPISGHVMETDGDPISGADIWILDIGGQPVWHDTTNAYGNYMSFEVSEGYYSVEAAKTGYITQIQGPYHVLNCDPAIVDFVLESDGCTFTPEPEAIIEDEPNCYDDYEDISNIGCSSVIWDTIPANCTFYGTSGDYNYNDATVRDTDWLEFDLTAESNVTLKGAAQYSMVFIIIRQGANEPCEGMENLFWAISPACDTATIECVLEAGKYWVWAAPEEFTGIECGSQYYLSLTSVSGTNCDYAAGDLNHSGVFNGIDVTFAVSYFKGGAVPPYSCFCHGYVWYVEGDFNGDCQFNGNDITRMVGYLKGFWSPGWCPDCPPTRY
jgi:hypothetical protein